MTFLIGFISTQIFFVIKKIRIIALYTVFDLFRHDNLATGDNYENIFFI